MDFRAGIRSILATRLVSVPHVWLWGSSPFVRSRICRPQQSWQLKRLIRIRVLAWAGHSNVIGETMKRVRAAANEFGAESLETAAKTAKKMWKENSTWLRQAMRDGKEIIDIGEDASRPVRSKFYKAEKEVIERRNCHVTRPEPKPEPQP
jgi:hypothetical protein